MMDEGNLRKLRKEGKKTEEEVKTAEGNRKGQSCHSMHKQKWLVRTEMASEKNQSTRPAVQCKKEN